MNPSYINYFNLTAPLVTLSFGCILLFGWTLLREEKALLWIALGYILSAAGMTMQSVMTNEDLARWTIVSAPLYIGGAWCAAQGIAKRYDTSAHPLVAFLIGIIGLSIIAYYSRVDNNLWVRTLTLNISILLVQVLALPSVFFSKKIANAWDRCLLWSFVVFSLIIFCRIVIVANARSSLDLVQLTQSTYWRFLLISSLFFSLWFMAILLGATIVTILKNLRHDRDHDALTGLLNRRAFFERATAVTSNDIEKAAVILALDIDHFKVVNDTFGHHTGDVVLKRVADTLRMTVGEQHLIARLGGEEFVVALFDATPEHVIEIAELIRTNLASLSIPNGPSKISASFGIAKYQDPTNLIGALKKADRALYNAKADGRDKIYQFSTSMQGVADDFDHSPAA